MTDEKQKLEPPLSLDMSFGEALERNAQANPDELELPKGKKNKRAKLKMLDPRIKTLEPRLKNVSQTRSRKM